MDAPPPIDQVRAGRDDHAASSGDSQYDAGEREWARKMSEQMAETANTVLALIQAGRAVPGKTQAGGITTPDHALYSEDGKVIVTLAPVYCSARLMELTLTYLIGYFTGWHYPVNPVGTNGVVIEL